MTKLYGSLNNRFEENNMYVKKIEVGTGVTMYYWSDRKPYEVVKVIDQENVVIRALDHKKIGEGFSNEWELISNPNNPEQELKFRYGKWYNVNRFNKKWLDEKAKKCENCKNPEVEMKYICFMAGLKENDLKKLDSGKEVIKYRPLQCGVSFGVAEYYFDYEF